MITIEELTSILSQVGVDMNRANASTLIKSADNDDNMRIDFSEFSDLWEAFQGVSEVRFWVGGDMRRANATSIIKGADKNGNSVIVY